MVASCRSAKAQEYGVVSQTSGQFSFGDSLGALSADARDLHDVVSAAFLSGEGEDRLQQSDFRVANGKLGGVDSDGDSTRAGGEVIAGQCPLPALVQLAVGVERKRMGGNHQAGTKFLSKVHQNFPSRV